MHWKPSRPNEPNGSEIPRRLARSTARRGRKRRSAFHSKSADVRSSDLVHVRESIRLTARCFGSKGTAVVSSRSSTRLSHRLHRSHASRKRARGSSPSSVVRPLTSLGHGTARCGDACLQSRAAHPANGHRRRSHGCVLRRRTRSCRRQLQAKCASTRFWPRSDANPRIRMVERIHACFRGLPHGSPRNPRRHAARSSFPIRAYVRSNLCGAEDRGQFSLRSGSSSSCHGRCPPVWTLPKPFPGTRPFGFGIPRSNLPYIVRVSLVRSTPGVWIAARSTPGLLIGRVPLPTPTTRRYRWDIDTFSPDPFWIPRGIDEPPLTGS